MTTPWKDDGGQENGFVEVRGDDSLPVGLVARQPARREAIAAVNACAGLDVEGLEGGALREALSALVGIRGLWRDHVRHAPRCPMNAKPLPTGPCACLVGREADRADRALRALGFRG